MAIVVSRVCGVAAAVAVLAGVFVAPAGAAYRVGIGDQDAAMFDSRSFKSLGLERVRYLVPWDFTRDRGQRGEVALWLRKATEAGAEPFVTFTASRGCWANNRYSSSSRCRAPSVSRYRAAFRAFRRAYPSVRVFAPWNEANHKSQPTARSPRRAAQYYDVVRRDCKGCVVVGADLLDQTGVERYAASVQRYAVGSIRRWGLHNYTSVNRKRSSSTRSFLRAVPGEVWLTETGGIVAFGRSFPYSESRAADRTKYMFRLADAYDTRLSGLRSKITRVYAYSLFGSPRGARFDAGLLDPDGSPRRAFATFRSLVSKRLK